MTPDNAQDAVLQPAGPRDAPGRRWSLRRFRKDKTGATAIEFAILAVPFFLIVFASLETFAAFAGEQLLATANDNMSRKLRTGEITFGMGRSTDMNEKQFRQAFCDEISIIMPCSATEVNTPAKLYLDVRSFTNFASIPVAIPRIGTGPYGDIDTSGFKFAPGAAGSINFVRAYYRWQIITDLVRPYITNIRPAGKTMPTDYLIVATSAFRNENYP